MKMFAYHFRRLAPWERIDRWCRLASKDEDGTFRICGRPAVIEFEGTRATRSGQETSERLGLLRDPRQARGGPLRGQDRGQRRSGLTARSFGCKPTQSSPSARFSPEVATLLI